MYEVSGKVKGNRDDDSAIHFSIQFILISTFFYCLFFASILTLSDAKCALVNILLAIVARVANRTVARVGAVNGVALAPSARLTRRRRAAVVQLAHDADLTRWALALERADQIVTRTAVEARGRCAVVNVCLAVRAAPAARTNAAIAAVMVLARAAVATRRRPLRALVDVLVAVLAGKVRRAVARVGIDTVYLGWGIMLHYVVATLVLHTKFKSDIFACTTRLRLTCAVCAVRAAIVDAIVDIHVAILAFKTGRTLTAIAIAIALVAPAAAAVEARIRIARLVQLIALLAGETGRAVAPIRAMPIATSAAVATRIVAALVDIVCAIGAVKAGQALAAVRAIAAKARSAVATRRIRAVVDAIAEAPCKAARALARVVAHRVDQSAVAAVIARLLVARVFLVNLAERRTPARLAMTGKVGRLVVVQEGERRSARRRRRSLATINHLARSVVPASWM